jgi:hypothetical protein
VVRLEVNSEGLPMPVAAMRAVVPLPNAAVAAVELLSRAWP